MRVGGGCVFLIATFYGLDGQVLESQRVQGIFSSSKFIQTGTGVHPASYSVGNSAIPRRKVAGAWR